MELYTRIPRIELPFSIGYQDRLMLMGSCFAENMGEKLKENRFRTEINPFGTLYNPLSIEASLRRLLSPEPFTENDLLEQDGVWHSLMHHSRFSSPSQTDCLRQINGRLASASTTLREASRLIITFGSSYIYRWKESDRVVANCHKLPDSCFRQGVAEVEEMERVWVELLMELWRVNPSLKLLFTVSPIRHWRDGAHANQLSKARLLLLIERLQRRFPEQTAYFPAYEIMLDELRDYRFYASDMLHPSPTAIDYIWELFLESCLTKEDRQLLAKWQEIKRALLHRPFQPHSEGHQRFLRQTLLKIQEIQEIMPYFDLQAEQKELQAQLL